MYLLSFVVLLASFFQEINSTTFTGFFPSSTYKLNLTAGDSLSVSVSFTSSGLNFRDIDLYLYNSAQTINGGSSVASATHYTWDPQSFTKTIPSTGQYSIWLTLDSGNPTDYQITITLNGNTVLTESSYIGQLSNFHRLNVGVNPCVLITSLTSTQDQFNLYLYGPNVDVWNGATLSTINLLNPNTYAESTVVLTATGLYNFKIKSTSSSLSFYRSYQIDANCHTCSEYLNYCSNCSSITVCTQCQTNYYVNSTNKCDLCTSLNQCLNCTSAGICTQCNSGYFSNSSGQCSLCQNILNYCTDCNINGTICYLCTNQSLLNFSSNLCVKCDFLISNCAYCQNNLTSPQCTNCSSTKYYLDNISHCSLCNTTLSNCQECQSSSNCILCQSYYFLNTSSQCQVCNNSISNCLNCTQDGLTCFQCLPQYFLAPDSSYGAICPLCLDYIQGCTLCDNSSFCTQCQLTYFIDLNNLCTFCQTVQQGCLTCNNSITCLTVINDSYYINSSNLSTKCQNVMYQCFECTSQTKCISCNLGYFLQNGTCHFCSDFIDFCGACKNNSFCIACNDTQFQNSSDGSCQCKKGWIVTHTCTTIYGCISSRKIFSNISCLACDSNKNYDYIQVNHTCKCSIGFSQIDTGECIQICGDGVRIFNQCDDGNIYEGDGCSSNCKIEQNYECQGSLNQISICKYAQNFVLQFLYITKIGVGNEGNIIFKISPKIDQINKIDFYNIISFKTSSSISFNHAQYEDGLLTINFDYEDQKLLSTSFQLNFDFTLSKYFKSTSSNFIIQTNQMVPPLNYQSENFTLREVLFVFGQILAGITFFLFLLSLFYHKMIGVQTLQVFQIILLLTITVTTQKSHIFYILNSLRYILGYLPIFTASRISLITPQRLRLYSQIQQFLGNLNLTIFVLMLFNVIYSGLNFFIDFKIDQYNQVKDKEPKELFNVQTRQTYEERRQQIGEQVVLNNSRMQLVYQRLFYPFAIFMLIPSSIYYFVHILGFNVGQKNAIFLKWAPLMGIMSILFIVLSQIKQLSTRQRSHSHAVNFERIDNTIKKQCLNYYSSCFVLKLSVYSLLILLLQNYFQSIQSLVFVFLGVEIIFLLILLKLSPYKQLFHNRSLILNSLVICCFQTILILDKHKIISSTILQVLLCILFCLLFIVSIIAYYRVYLEYIRQKYKRKQKNNENDMETEQQLTKKQKLLLNNRYLKSEELEKEAPSAVQKKTLHKNVNTSQSQAQISQSNFNQQIGVNTQNKDQNYDSLTMLKIRLRQSLKMKRDKQNL